MTDRPDPLTLKIEKAWRNWLCSSVSSPAQPGDDFEKYSGLRVSFHAGFREALRASQVALEEAPPISLEDAPAGVQEEPAEPDQEETRVCDCGVEYPARLGDRCIPCQHGSTLRPRIRNCRDSVRILSGGASEVEPDQTPPYAPAPTLAECLETTVECPGCRTIHPAGFNCQAPTNRPEGRS